eukprot:Skav236835  [mRNA]  locus=scaffold1027:49372:59337:+ [translate_table: standard]
MAEGWASRLIGGPPGSPSVLSAFCSLLKLVDSLGTRQAQHLLEGQLTVQVDADVYARVSHQEASFQERLAFQHSCLEAFAQDNTPADVPLDTVLGSADPATDPGRAMTDLQAHIEQVCASWTGAFPAPLNALEYATLVRPDPEAALLALIGREPLVTSAEVSVPTDVGGALPAVPPVVAQTAAPLPASSSVPSVSPTVTVPVLPPIGTSAVVPSDPVLGPTEVHFSSAPSRNKVPPHSGPRTAATVPPAPTVPRAVDEVLPSATDPSVPGTRTSPDPSVPPKKVRISTHGFTDLPVPGWVADLVPPWPVLTQKDHREFVADRVFLNLPPVPPNLDGFMPVPASTGPVNLTPNSLRLLLKQVQLRLLPSGACLGVTQQGTIQLPAATHVFVPSPSSIANCVVRTPAIADTRGLLYRASVHGMEFASCTRDGFTLMVGSAVKSPAVGIDFAIEKRMSTLGVPNYEAELRSIVVPKPMPPAAVPKPPPPGAEFEDIIEEDIPQVDERASSSTGHRIRSTDWQCPTPTCPNRINYVFGSKTVCPLCSVRRPRPAPKASGPVAKVGAKPGAKAKAATGPPLTVFGTTSRKRTREPAEVSPDRPVARRGYMAETLPASRFSRVLSQADCEVISILEAGISAPKLEDDPPIGESRGSFNWRSLEAWSLTNASWSMQRPMSRDPIVVTSHPPDETGIEQDGSSVQTSVDDATLPFNIDHELVYRPLQFDECLHLIMLSLPEDDGKVRPGFYQKVNFTCTVLEPVLSPLVFRVQWQSRTCLVIFDPSWFAFYTPVPGHSLTVIDAIGRGVLDHEPVYVVGPEPRSHILRHPQESAGTRFLELFSGTSGWSDALHFLGLEMPGVYIDADPIKATILAETRGLPLFTVDQLTPEVLGWNMVVLGDVKDPRWYKLTLAGPFRFVLFSSPCVSFSFGGGMAGFDSEAGELFFHSLHIIALLKPLFALGENVDGLVKHRQWYQAVEVARALDLPPWKILESDLASIVPMRRPRCFIQILFTDRKVPSPRNPSLRFPAPFWTLAPMVPLPPLSDDEITLLSDWRLLPPGKRTLDKSPTTTFRSRIAQEPLPVLMASYTKQHKLPRHTLEVKGLYTWLVAPHGEPRYLQAVEAARLMGYGPQYKIHSQHALAIRALGDSVSPLQVVSLLASLLRSHQIPFTLQDLDPHLLVVLMAVGWKPLRDLQLIQGTYLQYSMTESTGDMSLVLVDGHIRECALPCVTDDPLAFFSSALGLGLPVLSVEFGQTQPYLLHFRPLQVTTQMGPLLFSPLTQWREVLRITGSSMSMLLTTSVRPDTPLWMVPSRKLSLDLCVPSDSFLVLGANVRLVCPAGTTLQELPWPHWLVDSSTFTTITGQSCKITEAIPAGTVVLLQTPSLPFEVNGSLVPPCRSVATLDGPLRHRIFPLKGGVKPVVAIESALAELLGAHGVAPDHLKSRVDNVVTHLGAEVCNRCLSSKTPWAALKHEASSKNIRLVTTLERERLGKTDSLQTNDPWEQPAASSRKPSKSKRVAAQATVASVTLDASFFHAEAEPVPLVPLEGVLRGTPGLAVTNTQELEGRLPTLLAKSRSSGPAALFVLGACVDEVAAHRQRCSNVIAPGWVKGHASAIRGMLVRIGDADIQPSSKEIPMPKDPSPATTAFMVHIYKAETEHWEALEHGLSAFLRRVSFSKAQLVNQVWADAFYAGKKKVSPDKASYFHCFARLPEVAVAEFLELSGVSGLYNTPRTATHSRDDRFKILILPGSTLSEARQHADKIEPKGIVRTAKGFGIRVLAGHFAKARQTIFPELVLSEESDAPGPRRFKLLGVPREYDRSALKRFLRTLGWAAKVLKPQGHRAWLVSAAAPPPVRSAHCGTESIVIMEDVPSAPSALVASSHKGLCVRPPPGFTAAPIASAADVAMLPAVKSRYEQLEEKTTARVDDLEQKVTQLATALERHSETTTQSLHQLNDHITAVEAKVPDVSTLCGATDRRLAQMEATHDTALKDLKALLEQSPKVRAINSQHLVIPQRRFWSSGRIHVAVVQLGSLPVHFITVYLAPGAPPSSRRFDENSAILACAVDIALSLNGLVVLGGDFNAPATTFTPIGTLEQHGFCDAAIVALQKFGTPLQPTCLDATRHSFGYISSALVPLLTAVQVTNPHDLPTHALLRLSFDLPAVNPRVYKWLSPRPLDGLKINDSKVPLGLQTFHNSLASPEAPVADQFKAWAKGAERFLCSVGSIDGEDLSRPCWKGRCRSTRPVLVNLSPPRFKPGRPGDFSVPFPSVGIEVRKWQKYARQLQSLLRLLKRGSARAADPEYSREVNLLWKAIRRAPVQPRPLDHAASIFGFRFHRLPSVDIVDTWSQKVAAEASRKATAHWEQKKVAFTAALDHSCATQGGSFPFRLIREQPHPPVTAMSFTVPVKLAPQPWGPYGKAWIEVLNPEQFQAGQTFDDGTKIQELSGSKILVNRRLTRVEASNLQRTATETNPTDLGADIAYSYRIAAGSRNKRVQLGHRRLIRLRGLPLSRQYKSRILVAGIWTQALHACETSGLPKTILKRLRTQAARCVCFHKPGLNPWIACSLGAHDLVDPGFWTLIQRIRLFRQTWRDLPHFRPDLRRLLDTPGRYRSVVKLLLRQLDDHEWVYQGNFLFRDCCDRTFHLLGTPLSHVKWLLSFSWMVHVTGHFAHRLHCDSMDVLDPELSRVWTKYSSGDQGLLLTQLTGVTFTTDCLRSARGLQVDPRCPACGQLDSRVHRTRDCLRSAQARARLARTIPLDELRPQASGTVPTVL